MICLCGHIVTRYKNMKLRIEREEALRQVEIEREEYKLSEQKLELGRRYRHDMRHHFAAIRGLLVQGDTGQVVEYLNTLEEGLGEIEQRSYCRNTVINAVLSTLLSRAERAGIAVSVRAVIPGDIPFESSDVSILLANSLENAVNACMQVKGERTLELSAECTGGKFKWSFYINENGLLVIAFADDTISPMGSVSFVISHTVTDAIASEDGLLLRRTAT